MLQNLLLICVRTISALVSASCVILVISQVKRDRKSWLFVLVSASVAGDSFGAIILRITWEQVSPHVTNLIYLTIGMLTFVLQLTVYLFCMEFLNAWTPFRRLLALFLGALFIISVPVVVMIVYGFISATMIVHSDGTLDYQLPSLIYPFFACFIFSSWVTVYVLYEQIRKHRSDYKLSDISFVLGALAMLSAMYFPLIDVLRPYSLEEFFYAVGCVLLIRPVLQRGLFNPLAELNQTIGQRARSLSNVTQISQRITSALDLDSLASATVEEICQLFGYSAACLYVRQGKTFELTARAGAAANEIYRADYQLSVKRAVEHKEVIFENTSHRDGLSGKSYIEISIPLIMQQATAVDVIGVLSLYSVSSIPNNDLKALELLSQQIVTALNNVRLFQEKEVARRAANEASDAKMRFLAIMSHDLRTPLQTILLCSQFLERIEQGTVLLSDHIEDIIQIKKASFDMKHLIDKILDFSSIEAGKVVLDCKAIDPISILDRVKALSVALLQSGFL